MGVYLWLFLTGIHRSARNTCYRGWVVWYVFISRWYVKVIYVIVKSEKKKKKKKKDQDGSVLDSTADGSILKVCDECSYLFSSSFYVIIFICSLKRKKRRKIRNRRKLMWHRDDIIVIFSTTLPLSWFDSWSNRLYFSWIWFSSNKDHTVQWRSWSSWWLVSCFIINSHLQVRAFAMFYQLESLNLNNRAQG